MENYKPGRMGDCIPKKRVWAYGDRCFESTQCYYNLICDRNRCVCPDYSYTPDGPYMCRPSLLILKNKFQIFFSLL